MESQEGKGSGLGGDAEATLYEEAQGGDAESLNMLLAQHEGLVRLVVGRQWLADLPEEEALQAGRHGLWRAVLGYDPQRGSAFSTALHRRMIQFSTALAGPGWGWPLPSSLSRASAEQSALTARPAKAANSGSISMCRAVRWLCRRSSPMPALAL